MGVRFLNTYLLRTCSKESGSIKKSTFDLLENKKIVIDVSIYIYKFLESGRLADNFHKLLRLCVYHKVTPIFVFDGKPPVEKTQTLQKRRVEKLAAILTLQQQQPSPSSLQPLMETTPQQLHKLQLTATMVTKEHISMVKQIISEYRFSYIDAPHEADELCATLVKNGKAWCCLSDDMDMVVYGCPRIMRCLNMNTRSFMFYDMDIILKTLNITQENLRYICILSGTDYILSSKCTFNSEKEQLEHFNRIIRLYREWHNMALDNRCEKNPDISQSFIDWAITQLKDLHINYAKLLEINRLFTIRPT